MCDDKTERRLYLSCEFVKPNGKGLASHCENKIIYLKDKNKMSENKIVEDNVLDIEGNNYALSKNNFAEAIYNDTITISNESWENFRPLFETIQKILSPESTEIDNNDTLA